MSTTLGGTVNYDESAVQLQAGGAQWWTRELVVYVAQKDAICLRLEVAVGLS